MTKSRFKTTSILLYISLITLLVWLIWMSLAEWEGELGLGLFIVFWSSVLLLLLIVLVKSINIVEIDHDKIKYINWFTKKVITYQIDQMDGFVSTDEETRLGNSYKTIFLVVDNRLLGRISEFNYANFDELNKKISELPFLGYQSNSNIKTLKIMLGGVVRLD